METLLVIVTVVSLALALGLGVVAWRATREQQRRADARVAALRTAAGIGTPPALPIVDALESFDSEIPADADAGAMPHPDFLGSGYAAPESAGRQRGLVAAAAAFAILLVGFGVVRMSGDRPAAAAAAASPLELLALGHEREGARLAVAGLVRNPAEGSTVDHLSAVVLLFDEQGTFVTSARAPVDFMTLGAGDESPFTVRLDAPQTVARYRVSFRTDTTGVPHVDRREVPPAAAPAALDK